MARLSVPDFQEVAKVKYVGAILIGKGASLSGAQVDTERSY
ncbi:MAG: hypothetical protein ACYCSS_06655 [Sulfuriferula sp.]